MLGESWRAQCGHGTFNDVASSRGPDSCLSTHIICGAVRMPARPPQDDDDDVVQLITSCVSKIRSGGGGLSQTWQSTCPGVIGLIKVALKSQVLLHFVPLSVLLPSRHLSDIAWSIGGSPTRPLVSRLVYFPLPSPCLLVHLPHILVPMRSRNPPPCLR